MEKDNNFASWKTVLQWEVIRQIIRESIGVELDEISKEKGLELFAQKHQADDIYEMEFEDIESELIEIYIDLLGDGKKRNKNKPTVVEINGLPIKMDPGYISKWIEQNPNFKRYFSKRKDDSDEEEEDSNSTMYI